VAANYGRALATAKGKGKQLRLLRRNEIPTTTDLRKMEWEYMHTSNEWQRFHAKDRDKLEFAIVNKVSETYLHLAKGSFLCNFSSMSMSQPHIPNAPSAKLRRTGTNIQSASSTAKLNPALEAIKQRFGRYIQDYKLRPGVTEAPTCVICQEDIDGPAVSLKCRSKCVSAFHEECVLPWLDHKSECPICKQILGELRGDSPPGKMTWQFAKGSVPGYGNRGIIEITYDIPSGIQGPKHPNPGARFTGTYRHAYLPDVPEGRKVLRLLKRAFDAGLTFTVGTSLTTGQSNTVVWSGLHHKSTISGGPFGYPDPTYLQRIQEELKYKGIEEHDDDEEQEGEEEEEAQDEEDDDDFDDDDDEDEE